MDACFLSADQLSATHLGFGGWTHTLCVFACCCLPAEWMVTPMDCCACYFDDSTYLKEALSLTPTYLRGTGNMFDYKDWQIPLGR